MSEGNSGGKQSYMKNIRFNANCYMIMANTSSKLPKLRKLTLANVP